MRGGSARFATGRSFLNKDAPPPGGVYGSTPDKWLNLPASYHNRSTAFSYADGHASLHHWLKSTTIRPSAPHAANLPIPIPVSPADEVADFDWMMEHMSIENLHAQKWKSGFASE